MVEGATAFVIVCKKYAYKLKKQLKNNKPDYDFSAIEDLRHFVFLDELKVNETLPPELRLELFPITGSYSYPEIDGPGRVISFCIRLDRKIVENQLSCGGLELFSEKADGDNIQLLIEYLYERLSETTSYSKSQESQLVWGTENALILRGRVRFRRHLERTQFDIRKAEAKMSGISIQADDEIKRFSVRKLIFYPILGEIDRLEEVLKTQTAIKIPEEFDYIIKTVPKLIDVMYRLEGRFWQRAENGFVRKCHHSLTLCNVIPLEERVVVYDALEFNSMLDYTDVTNEISMFIFDLSMRILRRGNSLEVDYKIIAFLDKYLEISGDFDCLHLLQFYLMTRALLAAFFYLQRILKGYPEHMAGFKKCILLSNVFERYGILGGRPRFIVLMHGFSGSGKSYFSRKIASATGAIRIRSDVERQRIWSKRRNRLEEKLRKGKVTFGGGTYTSGHSLIVYEQLNNLARLSLSAGFPVLLDATFLKWAYRVGFYSMAEVLKIPIMVFHVYASPDVVRERLKVRATLTGRKQDASEATVEIFEFQLRNYEGFREEEISRVIKVDSEKKIKKKTILELVDAQIEAYNERMFHKN